MQRNCTRLAAILTLVSLSSIAPIHSMAQSIESYSATGLPGQSLDNGATSYRFANGPSSFNDRMSYDSAYPDLAYALQEQPGGSVASGSSSGGGGASAGQQAQNPIANLVSLPLQSNWNYGVGPNDQTLFVANLQPVIPLKLNEHVNLITRPIMPLINSPEGTVGRNHGLGDVLWENFFVPVQPEGSAWMWGAGPSINLPTASDPGLSPQLWGIGVAGVVVYSKGPIVGGVLVNQSYLETGVSQPFLVQPFFNYNFTEGILKNCFINASGEFQADWRATSEARWNNVYGIGPGRNFKIFGQPIQISTRFAPYLNSPGNGANWQFRLNCNLLFPK